MQQFSTLQQIHNDFSNDVNVKKYNLYATVVEFVPCQQKNNGNGPNQYVILRVTDESLYDMKCDYQQDYANGIRYVKLFMEAFQMNHLPFIVTIGDVIRLIGVELSRQDNKF